MSLHTAGEVESGGSSCQLGCRSFPGGAEPVLGDVLVQMDVTSPSPGSLARARHPFQNCLRPRHGVGHAHGNSLFWNCLGRISQERYLGAEGTLSPLWGGPPRSLHPCLSPGLSLHGFTVLSKRFISPVPQTPADTELQPHCNCTWKRAPIFCRPPPSLRHLGPHISCNARVCGPRSPLALTHHGQVSPGLPAKGH